MGKKDIKKQKGFEDDMNFSLENRFRKGYKKNTRAIFLSFVLTIALMSALLTLVHTNHKVANLQWQMLFTASDCCVKDIDGAQVKKLTAQNNLEWSTLEQLDKMEYTKGSQTVVLNRGDNPYITMTTKLDSGRLPKAADEVAAERWTLMNLGIEPKINQKIEVYNQTIQQTETFQLVGILADVPSNKKYGLKCLNAPVRQDRSDAYNVYIRFKDGTNYEKNAAAIAKSLDIKTKQISKCPGREDTGELRKLDAEIIGVLMLIGMIVFYGVYRIALIARRKQYGVLRAIGMQKGQMQRMILRELCSIYAVSVPVGIAAGIGIALLISWLSGDSSQEIYLNNELVSMAPVIPYIQILICIVLIAVFICVVGILGGRKIVKSPVTQLLTGGEGSSGKKKFYGPRLKDKQGRMGALFTLAGKYIFKDKKTSVFCVLTICIGIVLFTALAYQEEIARTNREDTKEMFYLGGQYEMGVSWLASSKSGIGNSSLKKIENLKAVSGMKTASGFPVRVVDDQNVKRTDQYYDYMNERFLKNQNYPLAGNDGKDQVYQSILYGYNQSAMEKMKKYVIEGSYSEDGLKEDEIILMVLHMDATGENNSPGNYKEGTPLMQYHAGDTIRMKYRTDFDTDNDAYNQMKDTDADYTYKTYKVAAIVSFSYMQDSNRTIYPLLITSESQVRKICPDVHTQRLYIDGDSSLTAGQQNDLESQLIRISNQEINISTRSMISDIEKNEMLYQKQIVYIFGIALVAFVLVLINIFNNLNYRMQIRTQEICMYRAIGMSVKMIRKMMIFENGLLGCIGILCGGLLANPILRYLYSRSDMKVYGHLFHFDYIAFFTISLVTIMICVVLSLFISKSWKTKKIMESIGEIS